MKVTAYIGLGANLGDPVDQVKSAMQSLADHADLQCEANSSLYVSEPMGPSDQPDYVNAVVKVSTTLSAEELLNVLQIIEHAHGRQRSAVQWSARTLDLDLLIYGDQIINTERLKVPHPGISERLFVLYPLEEIEGKNFSIPGLGSLADLLLNCPVMKISKLDR